MFNNKRKGFTLAEVLITLGIIGVVAAVTIPTIINDAHRRGYVAQLQKTYSSVSVAVNLLLAEELSSDLERTYIVENSGNMEGIRQFFNRNFHVIRDCGIKTGGETCDCLGTDYVNLKANPVAHIPPIADSYCVMIGSGETICMYQNRTNHQAIFERSSEPQYASHGSFGVVIDVNGPNKPNQSGIDLFSFEIYTDGKVGESYHRMRPERCFEENNDYASGCFTRIKDRGWKFDY